MVLNKFTSIPKVFFLCQISFVSQSAIDDRTVRINPKNAEFAAAINKKQSLIYLGKIGQVSQRKTIRKSKQKILDIDFSPDGVHLAASLTDGDVYIWDLNSFQLIRQLTAS